MQWAESADATAAPQTPRKSALCGDFVLMGAWDVEILKNFGVGPGAR